MKTYQFLMIMGALSAIASNTEQTQALVVYCGVLAPMLMGWGIGLAIVEYIKLGETKV